MEKYVFGFLLSVILGTGLFVVVYTMPSATELKAKEIGRLKVACDRKGEESRDCRYLDSLIGTK